MLRFTRPLLVLALALGCQGCVAIAAGTVVGTAGAVTVGAAKLGTHVVASGVRAAIPGESRRERERRERRERQQAEREARRNR